MCLIGKPSVLGWESKCAWSKKQACCHVSYFSANVAAALFFPTIKNVVSESFCKFAVGITS